MSIGKYKVGDRVIVKSLDWYNENKNSVGTVPVPCAFVREMSSFCGKVVTIRRVNLSSYSIEESYSYSWSDEMFEGFADSGDLFAKTNDVEFLPKSVDACARVLGVSPEVCVNGYAGVIFEKLQELYICRDAYWKLASNWKPDYTDIKTKKHCIVTRRGRLSVATTTETNRAFAFPTPEMAEMFVRNFGAKLNLCKDML